MKIGNDPLENLKKGLALRPRILHQKLQYFQNRISVFTQIKKIVY